MKNQPRQTVVQNGAPDRAAIRAGMEATREAFHALLGSISEADWRRKSVSTAFTIAELVEHIVHSTKDVPLYVEYARQGKNLYNLPTFITTRINYLMTRWNARKETPQSMVKRYDAAYEAALKALDRVRDDEWRLGANFFGEGYWTVEFIFRGITEHFEEHAAQIRESLGQRAGDDNE